MKKVFALLMVVFLLIGIVPVYAEEAYPPVEIRDEMLENPHNYVAKTQKFKVTVRMRRHQWGKYRSRIYRVDLTGQETVAELTALGTRLWKEGAGYVVENYSGTSDASGPVSFSVEMSGRAYDPGSYLIVCCCEVDGQPLPDTAYATAVHIVPEEIPLEKLNFYLCDENWENPRLMDPNEPLIISDEINPDTAKPFPVYIYVEKVPYNATCLLSYVEPEYDSLYGAGMPVFYGGWYGQGYLRIGGNFCGENPMRIYLSDYWKKTPETYVYGPTCVVPTHELGDSAQVISKPTATKPGITRGKCARCMYDVEIQAPAIFTDTKTPSYYSDAVDYCYEHQIVNGLTTTTFGPGEKITRGQVMTLLYRLAGGEKPTQSGTFTDVAEGRFYTDAVNWAAQMGIARGVTATEFAPENPVTREQLATFLHRFAQCLGVEGTEQPAQLDSFTDADQVGAFAQDSFRWAVGNGLINGMTATTLAPKDNAQRAQFVTILYRLIQANPDSF